MSIKSLETTSLIPHKADTWKREDFLKYAEYIKKAMSTWGKACTCYYEDLGLIVSTTPDTPKLNATISIIDAITKKCLYPPKPSHKKTTSDL